MAVGGTALQVGHNYAFTRGFELFLTDMLDDPAFWHGYAERLTDWAIEYMTAFLEPIADLVDIVQFTEDLGTQRGLFMRPAQYRSFLKPYHRRWMEAVHRLAPHAKIAIHTCGSVYDVIPDLIEIGIEILNPIQPRAANMEPWRLKREFGRDLSFLGGVDIQDLLPNGTVDEVRAATRELIETLGPGGGVHPRPVAPVPAGRPGREHRGHVRHRAARGDLSAAGGPLTSAGCTPPARLGPLEHPDEVRVQVAVRVIAGVVRRPVGRVRLEPVPDDDHPGDRVLDAAEGPDGDAGEDRRTQRRRLLDLRGDDRDPQDVGLDLVPDAAPGAPAERPDLVDRRCPSRRARRRCAGR